MDLREKLELLGLEPTLYDAPTGMTVADDPRDYEILASAECSGCTLLAVRGPSGQIDVATTDDGCQLHRDALTDASESAIREWAQLNYA